MLDDVAAWRSPGRLAARRATDSFLTFMRAKESSKSPAAAPRPLRGSRAASRVIFVRVPGEIWPELLAASASPSSLSRLSYTIRKLVCVLCALESLSRGQSIAAGTRRAGIKQVTGWRWYRAFKKRGIAGLLPRTHQAGRKPNSPQHRKRSFLLPVHVALGDLRMRGGRVAFAASARPVLSPSLRRQSRRAARNLERAIPAALRDILQPKEASA